MKRKKYTLKSLFNEAKAILEKYNYQSIGSYLSVKVQYCEVDGVEFIIRYGSNQLLGEDDDPTIYGFGIIGEQALNNFEREIADELKIELPKKINIDDFSIF